MKQKSTVIDQQFSGNGGFVFMVILILIQESKFYRIHIY